ncbi:MAG: 1-deoxy-D-xylulose-5-phosphate synthase N-terminal domain-containing protein [Actinomycetota bacterium]
MTYEMENIARGIRKRVLSHVLANNGGYMSQACSSAELLSVLYGGGLHFAEVDTPIDPPVFTGVPHIGDHSYVTGAQFYGAKSAELDRLIISPAHYALVVYAALIETGRLREDALNFFNKDGSTVEMIGAEHSPGFETTTGSLSQALSQAGGIALARKLRGESGKTWVFMSDGEFQEGQTWEALAASSFHRLSKLRVIVDVNKAQCDGPMDTVMSIEPLAERIRSFGWAVSVVDGTFAFRYFLCSERTERQTTCSALLHGSSAWTSTSCRACSCAALSQIYWCRRARKV